MTLQTITGPSIREALADARRLFGADVVMLQSAPAVGGAPASVTVAFDLATAPARPRARPATPPASVLTSGSARTYGYGAPRKGRPAEAAPLAAAPSPALGVLDALLQGDAAASEAAPAVLARSSDGAAARLDPPPLTPPVQEGDCDGSAVALQTASPLLQGEGQGEGTPSTASGTSLDAAAPEVADPTPEAGPTAADLAALRARLGQLEAALDAVRPIPAPARPPVVFVGPAGDGKTSLALRLARHPGLADAACPAAIIVAPDGEAGPDAAPLFWSAGVPAAVVRTVDEVREALRTFADADLLIVDTPALPLDAERAAPVVARLGRLLAPLGAADVVLAVSASRAPATLSADTLAACGLRPDGLALTRLDEAPADGWAAALALPLRFLTDGPDALAVAAPDAGPGLPDADDLVLAPFADPPVERPLPGPPPLGEGESLGSVVEEVPVAREIAESAPEVADPVCGAAEVAPSLTVALPAWRPVAARGPARPFVPPTVVRTAPAVTSAPASGSGLWSLVAPVPPTVAA